MFAEPFFTTVSSKCNVKKCDEIFERHSFTEDEAFPYWTLQELSYVITVWEKCQLCLLDHELHCLTYAKNNHAVIIIHVDRFERQNKFLSKTVSISSHSATSVRHLVSAHSSCDEKNYTAYFFSS